ncbi:uncharacterized protein FIESC28_07257 [Fusarium coffeatum]|uniref:Heterokaryon incompatibility domain-containing protein n=1 Tax=Fusarium coffeatum TaxID=231269 RepID=A0A366RGS9_9HYPO|nr:uncharacterized protein FIESC28_07257 [Fusarium coffeatum]RBR15616.1 hypothetical protein FIESC28_07257 [Fusarium coffeatum]
MEQWSRGSPRGLTYWIGNSNFLLYTTSPSELKPCASFIGTGRDVGHRRSSHVPVITEWLRECHENHPNCSPSTDAALPTRLLDIGSGCEDLVQLIEVASGQRGRYTALSHCWGGGIDIRTTKGNYASQKKGLRYCDLPLSFQHATTVTRGLGIRYLWIDALCIIQDSQSDWEIESGNMGAIYQHAYLVIGADMSSNSFGGFLDVQSGGYNGDGWPIATVNNDIIYARSEHSGNNNYGGAHPLYNEPLSDRAWTLQEQVLSSRMVHFASKEMVWESKHFQDHGAGEYLAGLWREDLPMGLLWEYRGERSSRVVPYRAPSWSWASVNLDVRPYDESGGFTDHNNTLKKVYAKVIEGKCIPAGNDPLGAVSGGLLRVSAPLLKMEDSLDVLSLFDFPGVQEGNLFCLFIGEVTCGAGGSPVRGLILLQLF